jgi:AraC-like DNA-binding protein
MKRESKRIQLTRQAIQIILASQPEDFKYLTVNWIARKLGVSVPNLSRAFKQEKGFPLRQYLSEVKLGHCFLLFEQNPKITVKEVAELMDYSSSNYLRKIFRKSNGISPGKLSRFIRQP